MEIKEIKKTKKWAELVEYYLNEWAGDGWQYDPAMQGLALSDCFNDTAWEVNDSFPGLEEGEIEQIKEELELIVFEAAKKRYEGVD